MKIEEIKQKLEEKYSEGHTNDEVIKPILERIESMDSSLREILESFLMDRQYNDVDIEGFSINRLKNEYNMNEIDALLTLDELKKEPEKTLQKLRENK